MLRLVLRAIGTSIIGIFFAFLTAWLIINWISGCGETFHYADGSIHQGECLSVVELFYPFKE